MQNTTQQMNELKAIVGSFVEETKSTDIYMFLQWVECKTRAENRRNEADTDSKEKI